VELTSAADEPATLAPTLFCIFAIRFATALTTLALTSLIKAGRPQHAAHTTGV
jgi:hypothetical protein